MRTIVETAREWKVPPTTIYGTGNGEWTETDRSLALAYTMYERALCPCGCGFPRRIAQNDNIDGWIEAEETVCYVRKALDQWSDEHAKDKEPGVLVGPVDTRDEKDVAEGRVPV